MDEPYDFDRELAEVERFIAAVQAGDIGTSAAMAAYRDRHRPAIDRLRAELASFRALLAEEDGEPATGVLDEDVAEEDLDAPPTRHPGHRDDPEGDA